MRASWWVRVVVVIAGVVAPVGPVAAQQPSSTTTTATATATTAPATASTAPGYTVAGGSDIPKERIDIPQGGSLDAVFQLMVANPTGEEIGAAFRSDAAQGISATPVNPDDSAVKLRPGERRKIPFTIRTSSDVPAGDYDVTVGMVRNDISEGGVAFIPGIAQTVRLRIGGVAIPVTVLAIDRQTKQPVNSGVLLVERVKEADKQPVRIPVGRGSGSELAIDVVQGNYEASFLLDGRSIARKAFTASPGGRPVVQLEVDAVQFQSVAYRKVKGSGGELANVQLDAIVVNNLAPLEKTRIVLRVLRDKKQINDKPIQELAVLPLGTTTVSTMYAPEGGWSAGVYQFELRLENGPVTVRAAQVPKLVVDAEASWWWWIAIAVAVLLVIVLVMFVRRRRRRPGAPPAAGLSNRERRLAARQARREDQAAAHAQAEADVAAATAIGAVALSPGRAPKRSRRDRRKERRAARTGEAVEPVLPPETAPRTDGFDAMLAPSTTPIAADLAPREPSAAPASPLTASPSTPSVAPRPAPQRAVRAPVMVAATFVPPGPLDVPRPHVAPPVATPMPSGVLPPGLPPGLPRAAPRSFVDAPMPTPPASYGNVLPTVAGAPRPAATTRPPAPARPTQQAVPRAAPNSPAAVPVWQSPDGQPSTGSPAPPARESGAPGNGPRWSSDND